MEEVASEWIQKLTSEMREKADVCQKHLLQAKWPVEPAIAEGEYTQFEEVAKGTWLNYTGGDDLKMQRDALVAKFQEVSDSYDLCEKTWAKPDMEENQTIIDKVDSLIFVVKTMKGISKNEGQVVKLKRYAKAQRERLANSEALRAYFPAALASVLQII